MAKNFTNEQEGQEHIARFEEMLKNDETCFFNLETFEFLLEHYTGTSNFETALKVCKLAMEQYPYSSDIMAEYTRLLIPGGNYDEAFDVIEKAESLMPSNADIIILKATLMGLKGYQTESVEYLLEREHLFEEKDLVYFSMAAAYQALADYDLAITYYKQALENNPAHENALYELAFCLEITEELESHVAWFQQFTDADPFSQQAWFNLGIIYNKLELWEKAVDAFEYALAIKEEFPLAWFHLGNSYMNMEAHEKALEAYNRTKDLEEPNPETLVYIGACYEQMERFDDAIASYKVALKLDSMYDDAWYGIGMCLLAVDKSFEAIHFFNKALALNNDNEMYWLALAQAEYKTGNVVSSAEAYEEVCNRDPGCIDMWLEWSYIYYDQGDYSRAINLITSGIDEVPDEAELYYRAVVYLIGAGNYKEALTYLENALILDFEQHTVLFDFFEELETQKALYKIIEQYRSKNQL